MSYITLIEIAYWNTPKRRYKKLELDYINAL